MNYNYKKICGQCFQSSCIFFFVFLVINFFFTVHQLKWRTSSQMKPTKYFVFFISVRCSSLYNVPELFFRSHFDNVVNIWVIFFFSNFISLEKFHPFDIVHFFHLFDGFCPTNWCPNSKIILSFHFFFP